jgi:hypothetical protein
MVQRTCAAGAPLSVGKLLGAVAGGSQVGATRIQMIGVRRPPLTYIRPAFASRGITHLV